jgi:hypothetical protein
MLLINVDVMKSGSGYRRLELGLCFRWLTGRCTCETIVQPTSLLHQQYNTEQPAPLARFRSTNPSDTQTVETCARPGTHGRDDRGV